MSLTSLLRTDRLAAEIVDAFILPVPHKIEFPTIIPLRDQANAQLIGTAVDYAIRFELKRRWPRAKERAWIAEDVEAQAAVLNGARTVRGAKRFVEGYWKQHRGVPSPKTLRALARWCLGLAEIDSAYRAPAEYVGVDVDKHTVDEVVDIFRACPWGKVLSLRKSGDMLLNPTFGTFSKQLNGADADLIVGDTLLDIKTVSRPRLDKSVLRQLAGYLFCMAGCLETDQEIPPVESVGVLFPRQSSLWVAPVYEVFDMDNISKHGLKFFRRARQVRREREESRAALRAILGTA